MDDYPEDYEDLDDDGEELYTSKILSPMSTVLIETHQEIIFLGVILSAIPDVGFLISQTHQEIDPPTFAESQDLASLKYPKPVETLVPFSSVHYVQSIEDLTEQNLLAELRQDLDRFNAQSSPHTSSSTTRPRKKVWETFITYLDRGLTFLGV